MIQNLARAPRHPHPSGSPLVRLLAALIEAPVPASKDAFAERFSHWFEWRDAIALSAVLNAAPSEVDGRIDAVGVVQNDVRRVKAALDRLARDPVAAPRPGRSMLPASASPPTEPAVDLASLRQRHVDAQREMASQIGSLRRRLRAALASTSPAMAKLAALDAVMEHVVGEREHLLLAALPRRLAAHFEQQDVASVTRELQAVLAAELDLRWQPIEALREALVQVSLRPSTFSS